MDLKFLNQFSGSAHWALRIALASIFIFHGIDKFINVGMISQMMGMSSAVIIILGIAETAAGVLVLLGGFMQDWMTRLGGLIIVPIMLGAIFMVHAANGWNFMNGGMEFQVMTALVALFLLIKGNSINAAAS